MDVDAVAMDGSALGTAERIHAAAASDLTGYPPISDYAAIGDCRTGRAGLAPGLGDWLCLPHFSAPSVFAALLDRRRGGRFAIRPAAAFRTERRYVDGTNVLQTDFTTDKGRLRVTDLMPIPHGERPRMEPERELLRVVEGLEGEVEVEVVFQPRFDYGRAEARLVCRGGLGWSCEHRGEVLLLGSEARLAPLPGGDALGGRMFVRAGERRRFSLAYAMRDMLVVPPLGPAADDRLARTVEWWRGWSGCCGFDHPYRPAVVRSALTLKLLTFSLSGAVVAAATTSLPEAVGAERNWDYRYCWLRDAATTLQAFVDLGFRAEGRAYLEWLLHSTRLTRPRLQILYDVYGRARLPQEELGHLEGYRGSRPVRIGNDACRQLQLDIYGSAVAAAALYTERCGALDRATQRLLHEFGRVVCETWREPDSGLVGDPGRAPALHAFQAHVLDGAGQPGPAARHGPPDGAVWTATVGSATRSAPPSRRAASTPRAAATSGRSARAGWTPACWSWPSSATARRTTRGWSRPPSASAASWGGTA